MRKLQYKAHYYQQRGTVLVIAVFVVSIIIGVAARFTGNFQLTRARAEQGIIVSQLQQILFSTESFASWTLVQDADEDISQGRFGPGKNYDHLAEDWMRPLNVDVAKEITVKAELQDAGSRFNLNQLEGRPSPYKPDGLFAERFTPAQQRFMRLLQTEPNNLVDPSLAQQITEAVIDWVDEDNTPLGLGGAENSFYQSLEKPYRAANRPFVSVTELRQVRGVTDEIYQYLAPLLIALPNKQGINVNTAPATILRSLNQQNVETPLSEQDAATLVSTRPVEAVDDDAKSANQGLNAFENISDFLNSSDATSVFGSDSELLPAVDGLTTGSEFFILQTEVKMVDLDYQRQQTSLLRREMAPTGVRAVVVRRSREPL